MTDARAQPIVDLHVHLFPPRLFQAVWDWFESRDWTVHREYVEKVEQTLTAHGVTLATALSYPHKRGIARPLNEFMETVGQRHTMFRPFGSVHVDDDGLKDDIEHVIASKHIFGFKFQPLVQRFDVNDPRLDYLYERCLETNTPLIMHLGTAPMSNPFVGFEHFSRLMRRYPELLVCVAHMGAFETDKFLAALDDYPRLFLDTTMINVTTDLFDTTWHGPPEDLQRHADRICFGSDWPNVPYPYAEALASVPRFPLPEERLEDVYFENALRFLGDSENRNEEAYNAGR